MRLSPQPSAHLQNVGRGCQQWAPRPAFPSARHVPSMGQRCAMCLPLDSYFIPHPQFLQKLFVRHSSEWGILLLMPGTEQETVCRIIRQRDSKFSAGRNFRNCSKDSYFHFILLIFCLFLQYFCQFPPRFAKVDQPRAQHRVGNVPKNVLVGKDIHLDSACFLTRYPPISGSIFNSASKAKTCFRILFSLEILACSFFF